MRESTIERQRREYRFKIPPGSRGKVNRALETYAEKCLACVSVKVCIECTREAVIAAEPKIHRDIAYTDPADASRQLDIYATVDGKDHPVLVWIHGGAWRKGGQ